MLGKLRMKWLWKDNEVICFQWCRESVWQCFGGSVQRGKGNPASGTYRWKPRAAVSTYLTSGIKFMFHKVLSVAFCLPSLCRRCVHNFWSHEKRLPTATLERMLVLLHSLYSSCNVEHFLSLATNMSPDPTRNMFEYPLSECKFQVRRQWPQCTNQIFFF